MDILLTVLVFTALVHYDVIVLWIKLAYFDVIWPIFKISLAN